MSKKLALQEQRLRRCALDFEAKALEWEAVSVRQLQLVQSIFDDIPAVPERRWAARAASLEIVNDITNWRKNAPLDRPPVSRADFRTSARKLAKAITGFNEILAASAATMDAIDEINDEIGVLRGADLAKSRVQLFGDTLRLKIAVQAAIDFEPHSRRTRFRKEGRPRKTLEYVVAYDVLDGFFVLTGENPFRPGARGVGNLVEHVFKALSLQGSPKAAVQAAINRYVPLT